MLEKVLVCLDGSKAAEDTLTYVSEDTAFLNSKIVLLRIVGLPQITVPVQVPGVSSVPLNIEENIKQMPVRENEAMEYLKEMADLLERKQLDVTVEVLPGTPGAAIIEYAQENNFTLIIIGTHGHNAARRFFLGSTADYVLHHSDTPVLTIRPKV